MSKKMYSSWEKVFYLIVDHGFYYVLLFKNIVEPFVNQLIRRQRSESNCYKWKKESAEGPFHLSIWSSCNTMPFRYLDL